jgi:hypothetical protein
VPDPSCPLLFLGPRSSSQAPHPSDLGQVTFLLEGPSLLSEKARTGLQHNLLRALCSSCYTILHLTWNRTHIFHSQRVDRPRQQASPVLSSQDDKSLRKGLVPCASSLARCLWSLVKTGAEFGILCHCPRTVDSWFWDSKDLYRPHSEWQRQTS